MSWEDIYGREQIIRVLKAAVSEGQVAHAYLFYGSEGIGKRTLAALFANALLCPAKDPCGVCVHCKKVGGGSHPDLHWIEPEGKSLKIDQVRTLKRKAYLKPHEARFQVFVLVDAQSLTLEAANSLLKVLEDPPPASVFILLARNPASLLPTVVSRCQSFALPRLDDESMNKLLDHTGDIATQADRKRKVLWADGIPGRALAHASNSALLDNHQIAEMLHIFGDGQGFCEHLDRLAQDDSLLDFCDEFVLLLRDLLILQSTGQRDLLTGGINPELLQPFLSRWRAEAIREAIIALLKLQKDIQSPINVRLALERAFRRLKEVFEDADRCGNSL